MLIKIIRQRFDHTLETNKQSFILFVHYENSKTAQTILAYSLVSILRANLDHVLGTSQKSTKKGLTLLGIFSVIESLYDELYLHHAILFA